jgi:hypothetical protein
MGLIRGLSTDRVVAARGFHGNVLQRLQQIFRIVIARRVQFLATQ